MTRCLTLAVLLLQIAGSDRSRISGTYSDFHYIEEAGDVIGTEIEIRYSGGAYKGTLQVAEGVPEKPIPISIQVNGRKIRFSIPDGHAYSGDFEGEIRHGMLKGKFLFKNGTTELVRLPKKFKKCG